jgi:hypothetical protein
MPAALASPRTLGLPPAWRRSARIGGLVLVGLGIVTLVALSQPRTGVGRLLMSVHLPGLAARVFEDPAWRAAALYEAGRLDEAIALFRNGGRRASYNLGNALARSGDLQGAIAAYEEALRFNPRDADAQANRSLIARMLEEAIDRGPGGGIANGTAQYGARSTSPPTRTRTTTSTPRPAARALPATAKRAAAPRCPATAPSPGGGAPNRPPSTRPAARRAARWATPPGAAAPAPAPPWSPRPPSARPAG